MEDIQNISWRQDKVWLIGGTSDSVTIAKLLNHAAINLVVTVATPDILLAYPDDVIVHVGRMSRQQMQDFCQSQNIKTVVDASHPYAVAVSQEAIATTSQLNIPYLRYERVDYQSSARLIKSAQIIELDSFGTLLTGNYLQNQRVLLTVGCQVLPLFQAWHDQATLFARVLPKIDSLQTAIASGFSSDRLVAIRPPIDIEFEKALWRKWNISLVVTKASGKAGGEEIKHQAAKDLNTPLIVIRRPQISYPQQTSSLAEILIFCQQ